MTHSRNVSRTLTPILILVLGISPAPAMRIERPRAEIQRLEEAAARWVGVSEDEACVDLLRQDFWDHADLLRVRPACRPDGSVVVAVLDSGAMWEVSGPDRSPQQVLDSIGQISRADPVELRSVYDAEDYLTGAAKMIFDSSPPSYSIFDEVDCYPERKGVEAALDHGVWAGTVRILCARGATLLLSLETTQDGWLRYGGIRRIGTSAGQWRAR